jgi:hypothetical protein
MIYTEEKEPPSRQIHPNGAVRLAVKAHDERHAGGLCRIFRAQSKLTGVLSE